MSWIEHAAQTHAASEEVDSFLAAVAAIEASSCAIYDTKAAANTALGDLDDLSVVEVLADESRGGERTRYRKESGVYAYKMTMPPPLQLDHLSRPVLPARLLGRRSLGLRMYEAINEFRAGTREAWRILAIGDSIGTLFAQAMQTWLEGHLTSTPVYGYNNILPYGHVSNLGAQPLYPAAYTGTFNQKTDYDVSWVGNCVELDASEYCIYGGNSIYCDTLSIPIYTEPGAGVVKIEVAEIAGTNPAVGSGLWRNPTAPEIVSSHTLTGSELLIDANGSFGVTIVKLSVTLERRCVKITQVSGGTVRCASALMGQVETAAAVNIWREVAASNDFANALSAAEPIMAAIIADYDPDLIVFGFDEQRAACEHFLPLVEAAIASSGLTMPPLVVIDGNPFYSNGPSLDDADIADKIAFCEDFVASRLGWDISDGLALVGGIPGATQAGEQSDGIHPSLALYRYITFHWMVSRGFFPFKAVDAGGDATASDILRSTATRRVLSSNVATLLNSASLSDTGIATWSFLVTGTASGSRSASGLIDIATGSTSGSKGVAYINEAVTAFGYKAGTRPLGLAGGFSVKAAIVNATANGIARILWTADRNYNAAHAGNLTGAGIGFVIANGTVNGICWGASALQTSASSFALTTGASYQFVDLQVVLTPSPTAPTTGTLEWFANGVSLGTATYLYGDAKALRAEIENSADSANYSLRLTPPRVVTIR